MIDFKSIHDENAFERKLLADLAGQLSDDQLRLPLEAGWSISAVLCHLAFWDLRTLTLIQKWQAEGISPSPIDTDVVNEAARRLCLAVEPRTAVNLFVASAEAVDRAIEALSPEMELDIETNGKTVRLLRAKHRRTHLEEIMAALG